MRLGVCITLLQTRSVSKEVAATLKQIVPTYYICWSVLDSHAYTMSPVSCHSLPGLRVIVLA